MPPDPVTTTDDVRLPRSVEPITYRIALAPELEDARFIGSVEIDLVVHDPVDAVVCHAADLEILGASLAVGRGEAAEVAVSLDPERERVTFTPAAPLPPGPCSLHCTFTGVLNDKLRGFYRSTFVDDEGVAHTIATTQMESTDARRAFPCFDEPDRKAVFEITLDVDPTLAAFSNSPVVSEQITAAGRRLVRFAPTMKMSSYLVAFAVGPLEATEPVDVDGVPVRVISAPGKAPLTGFALEVAAHALRFFTDYFAIPYPAEKLDLAAIPDFAFGAMENLGLVTFRETALLVDPETAARTELERVADVVSHEIAHMWFGDLVTMGWWEGIWLNEAFATFMEVLCVDAFRPAWERWVSFGLEREAALAVDGLPSTRPIEYPVGSPEEANGMFDVLTYQKGGSVLRMLEQYLGPEVFRDGVRAYLRAHAYANTVTADLWNALEEASGQGVRAMMDTWILQGGHPLVQLADGRLSQQPFDYLPETPASESAIGGPWQVPVLLRTVDAERGSGERLLLTAEPQPLAEAGDGPLLLNAGGWGVYRAAYDRAHLGRLAERLGELRPLERAGLLADAWALVLAGHSPLADFVPLASSLRDEEEPSTFGVVVTALDLCHRVVDEADRPAVATATTALLGPRAAALGFDPRPGEPERLPTLRALLVRAMGVLAQDPGVRAEAAARFDASPAGGGTVPIDADVEDAVLAVVAAQLRPGDYEAMLERYRHPATPQDEIRYLYALAAFPDPGLARRTFDLVLDEVRTQNGPFVVTSLLANRVTGPSVWDQVVAHWDTLLARFPLNTQSRMVEGARQLCWPPEQAQAVTDFLVAHPLNSGQRQVTQMLQRLAVALSFARRERAGLPALLGSVAGA